MGRVCQKSKETPSRSNSRRRLCRDRAFLSIQFSTTIVHPLGRAR